LSRPARDKHNPNSKNMLVSCISPPWVSSSHCFGKQQRNIEKHLRTHLWSNPFLFFFFTHPPAPALRLIKVPVPGKVFGCLSGPRFISFIFIHGSPPSLVFGLRPGILGCQTLVFSPPRWQSSLSTRTSVGGVITIAAIYMYF
jgi:hypothetical protein